MKRGSILKMAKYLDQDGELTAKQYFRIITGAINYMHWNGSKMKSDIPIPEMFKKDHYYRIKKIIESWKS